MRYTLVREQNRHVAIAVGVRPAAHNRRTCRVSTPPCRAWRTSARIPSCSCRGISSMVAPRTVRPPRYLGGIATLAIPPRSSLCHSHASWFSGLRLWRTGLNYIVSDLPNAAMLLAVLLCRRKCRVLLGAGTNAIVCSRHATYSKFSVLADNGGS